MNLDLDLELRFALFANVRAVVERGGVIAARELNAGIIFHGERVPIPALRSRNRHGDGVGER